MCWTKESWPSGSDFIRYAPFFLHQAPDSDCAKAGLGQFDDAVRYEWLEDQYNIEISSMLRFSFSSKQTDLN